jgi:hypothetical protein
VFSQTARQGATGCSIQFRLSPVAFSPKLEYNSPKHSQERFYANNKHQGPREAVAGRAFARVCSPLPHRGWLACLEALTRHLTSP